MCCIYHVFPDSAALYKEESMGKISNTMNYYFSDNHRFADLFNVVFFQGRPVVRAEELSETSEVYHQPETEKPKAGLQGKRAERIRDVCKKLKTGEVLRILALESQELVDYAMPYRCMQYDTMEYGKQLEELRKKNEREELLTTSQELLCGIRKEDRLIPVYTLCLYHGEDKWDGPRSLKDMMAFSAESDEFQEWFHDYPLHLYCLNEAEDLELFHTEVGQLFRALQYRSDRAGLRKLLEANSEYQHLDRDTLEAISVMLKFPTAWEKREIIMSKNEEREEFNMCQALIEWEAEAKEIGENLKIIKQVQKKLQKGKAAEKIAEELEESLENVERIYAAVDKCGLEADAMKIYEELQKMAPVQ